MPVCEDASCAAAGPPSRRRKIAGRHVPHRRQAVGGLRGAAITPRRARHDRPWQVTMPSHRRSPTPSASPMLAVGNDYTGTSGRPTLSGTGPRIALHRLTRCAKPGGRRRTRAALESRRRRVSARNERFSVQRRGMAHSCCDNLPTPSGELAGRDHMTAPTRQPSRRTRPVAQHCCVRHARRDRALMRMLRRACQHYQGPDDAQCANCKNRKAAKGDPHHDRRVEPMLRARDVPAPWQNRPRDAGLAASFWVTTLTTAAPSVA